jgi:Phage tail protein (Tail_P2_I)
MGYVDFARKTEAPWLSRPVGGAFVEANAIVHDVAADGAREAVKARFIGLAPADALPYHAGERLLEQGAGETEDAWRARLLDAWDEWAWAGTPRGLERALELFYEPAAIYEAFDWYPGDPAWARFWVVLGPSGHPFGPTKKVGSGPAWKVGDGTLVGVTGATSEDVARLRRTIKLWKPGNTTCADVIAAAGAPVVGTGWHVGDGTVVGGQNAHVSVP